MEFARDQELARRASELSDALLLGPEGELRGYGAPPFGADHSIWGVGLYAHKDEDVIVVIVDRAEAESLAGPEPVPLLEVETCRVALERLGMAPEWRDAYALGLPEPRLHVATGDQLQIHTRGTVGASATWGNGRTGVLTAGHVARRSVIPRVSGRRIGTVVALHDPSHGRSNVGADVALIELRPGESCSPMRGSAFVSGQSNVDLMSSGGPLKATIVAKTAWFYVASVNGTYGDTYLTAQGVTKRGDSGTVAIDPTSNKIVGHVVGSAPGAATLVQDASYQVQALRTLPKFARLTI